MQERERLLYGGTGFRIKGVWAECDFNGSYRQGRQGSFGIYRCKCIHNINKYTGNAPCGMASDFFTLNVNLNKETIYIVDEASLISNSGIDSAFGSGHLLDDLVEYVYSNDSNKLILVGDSAQLPPVGLAVSDALDPQFMGSYGNVVYSQLRSVVRQAKTSGILHNAAILRGDD